MNALRTSLVALCLAAPAAAQDRADQATRPPFVQGLQREIHELERRAAEEARHFERLMRLKVAWDLLLPFDPAELLLGCDPGGRGVDELSKELAAELDEEARLKQRFVAEGAREPQLPPAGLRPTPPRGGDPVAAGPTRVEATPDLAPGPGAGTERGPSRPGAGRGPLLPGEETRYGPLVPLLELPGPRLEASAALDPFGQGGAAIRLAPVAYVPKRARALLRAGMTVEAMALLRRATDGVEAPEPVLLFMLAQAHGSSATSTRPRPPTSASSSSTRAATPRAARSSACGRAAQLVLQHLRWRAENLPFTPPDLEGLR
ncbi:MAG: hypothetical protein R3F30_10370 [Planctomycetota bacterium]